MRWPVRISLFAAAAMLGSAPARALPDTPPRASFATIAAPDVLASPAVAEMRALVREKTRIRVIVTLNQPADVADNGEPSARAARGRAIAGAQDALARRVHRGRRAIDPADRFRSVPALAMTVDAAELERLLSDEAAETVQLDRPARLVPRLAEMREITKVETIWPNNRGAKGRGELIAIIDEGLDSEIPDLKGRVAGEACVSNLPTCFNPKTQAFDKTATRGRFAAWTCRSKPEATHAAGRFCRRYTHGGVVSIVAAGGEEGEFAGFAPKLDVVFVRLELDRASIGSYARAFDAAIEGAGGRRPDVITTSIGSTDDRSATLCEGVNPALDKIFKLARRLRIPVLNSAGNDGAGLIDFPGCHPLVIAVGASTEKDDKLAGFADVNDMVDMLAPGDSVKVGTQAQETSGSSFSTPSVAATVAQLRRAFPDLTPDEILTGLRCSGKRVKPNAPQGRFVSVPRLDAAAAYRFLEERKPPAVSFDFDGRSEVRGWTFGNGPWSVGGGSLKRNLIDMALPTTSATVDQCFDDFHVEAGLMAQFEGQGTSGAGEPSAEVVTGNFGALLLTTTASVNAAVADTAPADGYVAGFGRNSARPDGFAYIYRVKNYTHDPAARPADAVFGASLCSLASTPVGLTGFQRLGVLKRGASLTMFLNGAEVCSARITEPDDTGALGVIRGVGTFATKTNRATTTRYLTEVDYLRIEPR